VIFYISKIMPLLFVCALKVRYLEFDRMISTGTVRPTFPWLPTPRDRNTPVIGGFISMFVLVLSVMILIALREKGLLSSILSLKVIEASEQ